MKLYVLLFLQLCLQNLIQLFKLLLFLMYNANEERNTGDTCEMRRETQLRGTNRSTGGS